MVKPRKASIKKLEKYLDKIKDEKDLLFKKRGKINNQLKTN